MDRQQRGVAPEFNRKIAVADGVHGILRHLRPAVFIDEPEQFGRENAVERKSRAGNGAAAEWADIDSFDGILKSMPVAVEHLDVSQQVMRKINRLRALQMRI